MDSLSYAHYPEEDAWVRACGVPHSLIPHKPERPEDYIAEVRRQAADHAREAIVRDLRVAAKFAPGSFAEAVEIVQGTKIYFPKPEESS